MLIIEGADLVGKSTLQRRCIQLLNATTDIGAGHMPMHLTRPPPGFNYYQSYLDLIARDTVWDRFHLSVLAYRQHDDLPCSMTPLKYSLVDAAIRQVGGFIVLVVESDDVIRRRFVERGDPMYSLEHILKVNRSFKEMLDDKNVLVRGENYRPDLDMIMYPDGGDITARRAENVVGLYLDRQRELRKLMLR